MAGDAVDCVLEMSGSPVAVASATRLVRPGGWISLLGIGDGPDIMDLSTDVVMKGLSLYGIAGRRIPETWEQVTAYVRGGVIDVGTLITHRFALGDTMDAYDTFADAANTGALKVVLDGSESSSESIDTSDEHVVIGAGIS